MIFPAPDEFDLDVRLLAADHGSGQHPGGQDANTQHGQSCGDTCADTCQGSTCNHAPTCDCFATDPKQGCGMGPLTSDVTCPATCPAGCNA